MGSCAAPSAKGDDKFITTDYLQQCPPSLANTFLPFGSRFLIAFNSVKLAPGYTDSCSLILPG
ncbi:replication initiator protein [Escherichia coli]|nr:replication initiator protein [Escherichia coli]EFI4400176.1 replication initiator protein [Escherichia coli]MBF8843149.1 replication initiator protein [Escherichia coli]MBW1533054.1 hypothetical protein [Escherichia coli]MBW1557536.1 hypothetical protein [Escherichia coli]MCV5444444.1 hypothetical protein [Escherichia coli]